MFCKRPGRQGFTLIEVMVTLVILAIAAAFVVPSINAFFVNLRLKSSARVLLADMNLAKVSALKTLKPYTVLLGGVTGTQEGWIVFSDPNNNGVKDAGEKEIRNVSLEGGITFKNGLNTPVTFEKHGLLNRGSGTYTLQSVKYNKQIKLTVSPTGFIRIQ